MHGYMMPSIALKNNPQIIFTWLHYAATTGARMPAKSGNSRLCAISSQKLGEELPSSKRTGGGLIHGLRMGRIMQQAIGLLTGGAEGAGDAQDSHLSRRAARARGRQREIECHHGGPRRHGKTGGIPPAYTEAQRHRTASPDT